MVWICSESSDWNTSPPHSNFKLFFYFSTQCMLWLHQASSLVLYLSTAIFFTPYFPSTLGCPFPNYASKSPSSSTFLHKHFPGVQLFSNPPLAVMFVPCLYIYVQESDLSLGCLLCCLSALNTSQWTLLSCLIALKRQISQTVILLTSICSSNKYFLGTKFMQGIYYIEANSRIPYISDQLFAWSLVDSEGAVPQALWM